MSSSVVQQGLGVLRRSIPFLLAAGLAGSASAQEALVIYDSSIRPTLVDGAAQLTAMLEEQGLTVDLRDDPTGDPGDLTGFECVWDLRVDQVPTAIELARFTGLGLYGGSLYLAGENTAFAARNAAIVSVVTDLGGGAVMLDPAGPSGVVPTDIIEPTNPEHPLFAGCDPVPEVIYDGVANGQFLDAGNGTWLTGTPTSFGAAIWDRGALDFAPEASVVLLLDINWLATDDTGTLDFRVEDRSIPTANRQFAQELIAYQCFGALPSGDCGCRPRNHGYWHRYCLGTDAIDPGRHGRGQGPGPRNGSEDLPPGLLATVDGKLAVHGLEGCQALDEGPFSDPRLAALRELATLEFNLGAGWLNLSCPIELRPVVEDEGLTVRDALDLIAARLADGSDEALREARWIGEHVANGEALE